MLRSNTTNCYEITNQAHSISACVITNVSCLTAVCRPTVVQRLGSKSGLLQLTRPVSCIPVNSYSETYVKKFQSAVLDVSFYLFRFV